MPPRARRSSASASTSASPVAKSRARGRASNASTSSARSKSSASASKSAPRPRSQKPKANGKSKQAPIYLDDDSDEDEEDEDVDDSEDDFQAEDDEDEDEDEGEGDRDDDASEDDYENTSSKKGKASPRSAKRKSTASSSSASALKKQRTRRKSKDVDSDDDFDDDDDDDDEDSGRTRQSLGLVRSGIGAPTSGHVPPGQVSPHLFNLLKDLKDPAKNDRDWFKARDKLWRYCEQSWLSFIETLTENIMEKGDDTIPFLPPKDITYRIYRDVRFSNDKTPYKTEVQVTFSRTGRKGNWAGYHLSVSPSGRSYIAGGKWHPDSQALGKIRQHIMENDQLGQELREIVKAKEFVKMFGAPVKSVKQLTKDMDRQSLWGNYDQLKVAPKVAGLESDHPDMHWFRLKSFIVTRRFSDEEVLKPDFQDQICEIISTMRPLISVMNRMVFGQHIDGDAPPDAVEDDDDENDDDEDEEEDD